MSNIYRRDLEEVAYSMQPSIVVREDDEDASPPLNMEEYIYRGAEMMFGRVDSWVDDKTHNVVLGRNDVEQAMCKLDWLPHLKRHFRDCIARAMMMDAREEWVEFAVIRVEGLRNE